MKYENKDKVNVLIKDIEGKKKLLESLNENYLTITISKGNYTYLYMNPEKNSADLFQPLAAKFLESVKNLLESELARLHTELNRL
jgi:predicted nucleic-acid-binding Zn-ribbon protein